MAVLRRRVQDKTPAVPRVNAVEGTLDYLCHPGEEFPYSMKRFPMYLVFPTDESSRTRDREELQQTREAIELFSLLALVDNAAFVNIVDDFIPDDPEGEEEDVSQLGELHVYPMWICYLDGKLSLGNSVANVPFVTWGALLGCPDHPKTYSSLFRSAKQTLMEMGPAMREGIEDACPSWHWQIYNAASRVAGGQSTKKTNVSRVGLDFWSRSLGKLFDWEVPAVVLLTAVGYGSEPLEAQSTPVVLEREGVEKDYDSWAMMTKLQMLGPSLARLTELLARTNMCVFECDIDDRGLYQQQLGRAVLNTGYLYSTLFCGRSLCGLSGDSWGFPALQHDNHILRAEIKGHGFASDARICAVYSALSGATAIGYLTINADNGDFSLDNEEDEIEEPMTKTHWRWLAYALWSDTSKMRLRKLDMVATTLTLNDCSDIEAVVNTGFPESVHRDNIDDHTDLPEYGYVTIPEGTELLARSVSDEYDTAVVMSREYRCRARCNSANKDGSLELVLPGYGICKMKAVPGKFECDKMTRHPRVKASRITSLTLEVGEPECGFAIVRLLSLIGQNLRTLSLINGSDDEHSVRLDLLATACPQLEELCLYKFNTLVSSEAEVLQCWPLRQLRISGSETEPDLAPLLRNSAGLMSRQLVELEVYCGRIYPLEEIRTFEFTPGYIDTLKSHDGDYLPIAKEKVSLTSKLALISVVASSAGCVMGKAIHRLDSVLLGKIFAFAATPERRSVAVNCSSELDGCHHC